MIRIRQPCIYIKLFLCKNLIFNQKVTVLNVCDDFNKFGINYDDNN